MLIKPFVQRRSPCRCRLRGPSLKRGGVGEREVQPLYIHHKMCSDNRTRTELNTLLLLTELFRFVLIPLKARHAEEIGATAIGLMATSYFTPKTVGA